MKNKYAFLSVLIMLVLAAVNRILPHMPNLTPTESITIFGAAYLVRRYLAYLMPIIMLLLSDLVINNTTQRGFFTEQEGFVWFSDYMIYTALALILIALASSHLLKKVNAGSVLMAALSSSVIFFIVTNFGAWLSSHSNYSRDISGLVTCYTAAWPFFIPSLISTVLFSSVIFTAFEAFLRYSRKNTLISADI